MLVNALKSVMSSILCLYGLFKSLCRRGLTFLEMVADLLFVSAWYETRRSSKLAQMICQVLSLSNTSACIALQSELTLWDSLRSCPFR